MYDPEKVGYYMSKKRIGGSYTAHLKRKLAQNNYVTRNDKAPKRAGTGGGTTVPSPRPMTGVALAAPRPQTGHGHAPGTSGYKTTRPTAVRKIPLR